MYTLLSWKPKAPISSSKLSSRYNSERLGSKTGGWQISGWTSGDIYSILLGRLGGLGENIYSFSFHSNTQVTCFSLRKWQNWCLVTWHLLDDIISHYTKQMTWNKWSMCAPLTPMRLRSSQEKCPAFVLVNTESEEDSSCQKLHQASCLCQSYLKRIKVLCFWPSCCYYHVGWKESLRE